MFTSILDAVTRTPRRALTTAAVATVIAALPAAAQARDHGLRFSVSVPVVVDPCPPQPVVYAPEAGRVWVEPAYRTVCDRQWIEPTYRTVDAQVWVPPVTTTQTQRVYVPDQLGWRTVVSVDRWGPVLPAAAVGRGQPGPLRGPRRRRRRHARPLRHRPAAATGLRRALGRRRPAGTGDAGPLGDGRRCPRVAGPAARTPRSAAVLNRTIPPPRSSSRRRHFSPMLG